MHNSSPLDIFLVDVGIVAKTQHMPRFVQWESAFPEGYETWWQCSQLPQLSIMILNFSQVETKSVHNSSKKETKYPKNRGM